MLIGLGFAGEQHLKNELALFLLLFFLILPLANALFDWLSWWATRALGRRLLDALAARDGWRKGVAIVGHGLADLGVAVALLLAMAYSLAFGFEGYNQVAKLHEAVFDLPKAIQAAAQAPWREGFWLTAMLLTTLLPTFGHGVMLLGSPLGFVCLPTGKRQALADALDNYAHTPDEQIGISRNVALWMVRGQLFSYGVAVLLFIWLPGRIAAFIWLFSDGGLSGIVANAAYQGIATAEWLGQLMLGGQP